MGIFFLVWIVAIEFRISTPKKNNNNIFIEMRERFMWGCPNFLNEGFDKKDSIVLRFRDKGGSELQKEKKKKKKARGTRHWSLLLPIYHFSFYFSFRLYVL